MKQFSIHKVNKPVLQGKFKGGAVADEVADVSKVGVDGGEGTVGGHNHFNGEE
jgi:hypothetical protein